MKRLIFLVITTLFSISIEAADVNGYTAVYERPVTIPTPTNAANLYCSGASGVNPSAGNEYIIRDEAGWAQINNGAYNKFFVCPRDYTGRGGITITANGTAATPRYVGWWTDSGYSSTTHPVKMADTSKAKVRQFIFNGADYWVVDRLVFIPSGSTAISWAQSSGANNNIINRSLVEATTQGALAAVFVYGGNHYNTLQNSVVRNCRIRVERDDLGVQIDGFSWYTRIINNEIYNCTHTVQVGGNVPGDSVGTIIENNDLYLGTDRYHDQPDRAYWIGKYGDGNVIPSTDPAFKVNGPLACAESVMSLKWGSASAATPMRVEHNRIFGGRAHDDSDCGGDGGSVGVMIQISNYAQYIMLRRNIFYDSQGGIATYSAFVPSLYNIDVRTNLFARFRQYFTGQPVRVIHDMYGSNTRIAFNTVADVLGGPWMSVSARATEFACNTIVDGNTVNNGGNTIAKYNVYVGNSSTLNETLKRTYTMDAAKLATYSFYRKLHTGPERVYLSNIKPTTDSPFLTFCYDYTPTSGYGLAW